MPNSATCSRRRGSLASDGQLNPRSIVSSKLACRTATSLFGLRSTLHFMTGEVQMSWNPYDNLPRAASFSLTSSDLRQGEKLALPQVSGVFGAGGQDVSPQLSWSGFPSGTKSFVVTMVDPEAPTVLGFWHWAVVNIPGSVTELPTGAGDESGSRLPQGAFQLPNDARSMRYVGAAPPPGTGKHRYIFAVLALEAEKIEIDRGATPAWLMYMVFNGTLGRAFLEGWYER